MYEAMFGGNAWWFGYPAVFGTLFFVVRLGMMLIGGAGSDVDAGGIDVDAGGADADAHGDPGDAAKLLSVQTVGAFLMGFGWSGLAARHGFELSWMISLICGIAGGVAMVWALLLMLKAMHDLQSSGNVSIQEAVGAEGTVYVGIPAKGKGRGQVRLVISNRQRIYGAVTDGDPIERNARIRVTRVNQDNSLTVVTI